MLALHLVAINTTLLLPKRSQQRLSIPHPRNRARSDQATEREGTTQTAERSWVPASLRGHSTLAYPEVPRRQGLSPVPRISTPSGSGLGWRALTTGVGGEAGRHREVSVGHTEEGAGEPSGGAYLRLPAGR